MSSRGSGSMPSSRARQEQQENRDNSPDQGLEGDTGSRGWPCGDTVWGHSGQPAAGPRAGSAPQPGGGRPGCGPREIHAQGWDSPWASAEKQLQHEGRSGVGRGVGGRVWWQGRAPSALTDGRRPLLSPWPPPTFPQGPGFTRSVVVRASETTSPTPQFGGWGD